ncbi:MAG: hypothetical protein IPI50_08140 [Saprospiraceae bacterium]|nr:hypothetical protein [Saprospiraceae bacterium]
MELKDISLEKYLKKDPYKSIRSKVAKSSLPLKTKNLFNILLSDIEHDSFHYIYSPFIEDYLKYSWIKDFFELLPEHQWGIEDYFEILKFIFEIQTAELICKVLNEIKPELLNYQLLPENEFLLNLNRLVMIRSILEYPSVYQKEDVKYAMIPFSQQVNYIYILNYPDQIFKCWAFALDCNDNEIKDNLMLHISANKGLLDKKLSQIFLSSKKPENWKFVFDQLSNKINKQKARILCNSFLSSDLDVILYFFRRIIEKQLYSHPIILNKINDWSGLKFFKPDESKIKYFITCFLAHGENRLNTNINSSFDLIDIVALVRISGYINYMLKIKICNYLIETGTLDIIQFILSETAHSHQFRVVSDILYWALKQPEIEILAPAIKILNYFIYHVENKFSYDKSIDIFSRLELYLNSKHKNNIKISGTEYKWQTCTLNKQEIYKSLILLTRNIISLSETILKYRKLFNKENKGLLHKLFTDYNFDFTIYFYLKQSPNSLLIDNSERELFMNEKYHFNPFIVKYCFIIICEENEEYQKISASILALSELNKQEYELLFPILSKNDLVFNYFTLFITDNKILFHRFLTSCASCTNEVLKGKLLNFINLLDTSQMEKNELMRILNPLNI